MGNLFELRVISKTFKFSNIWMKYKIKTKDYLKHISNQKCWHLPVIPAPGEAESVESSVGTRLGKGVIIGTVSK